MANLNLLWWIWNCRSEFEFAVVNLNLPWWIWICLGEFEFAVVNLNLPWWIWICCGKSKFAVVNLNLPWRIWIYCGEFEITAVNLNFAVVNLNFAVVNLNLSWWVWNLRRPTSVTWQTFESKANLSFGWQNFFTAANLFIQSVYNLRGGGASWRGWQDSRVRLFYRSYFSRSLPVLGHIFQPFCKLKVPFQVSFQSKSQSFICLL